MIVIFFATQLILNNLMAAEWSDVLDSFNNGKPQSSQTSCSTQNASLCSSPFKTICSSMSSGSQFEVLKKQFRDEVSKTPVGDKLDSQYFEILAAEKVQDENFQNLKKVPDPINDLLADTISPDQSAKEKKSLSESEIAAEKAKQEAIEAKMKVAEAAREKIREDIAKQNENILKEQHVQLQLLSSLESKVLEHYQKSPREMNDFYESIRTVLLQQVKSSPQFALGSNEKVIQPTREDVIAKLKSVKFSSASSLVNAGSNGTHDQVSSAVGSISRYFDCCSTDGLSVNAYYDPRDNVLNLCPGLLLKYLEAGSGSLDSLGFVLGHEFGHSFDSQANIFTSNAQVQALFKKYPNASMDNLGTAKSFKNFLSCVNENFIADPGENFGTFPKAIDQLKNHGLVNLQNEVTRLSKLTPVDLDKIALFKRKMIQVSNRIEQYQYEYEQLKASSTLDGGKKLKTREPKVITVQQGELIADFEASFVIQDELEKIAPEKRADSLKAKLALFCKSGSEKEVNELAWGKVSDAIHPPDHFRVENYFRNPKIRQLLGCKPLKPTDRPWCNLSGASH